MKRFALPDPRIGNLPLYTHVPFPAKPLTKTALLVLQGGLVCTAFKLPEDKKAV